MCRGSRRVALLVPEGTEAFGRQSGIGKDVAEHAADDAAGAGDADGGPG